ncbi:hypothetical protein RR46_01270 [Papilio xuthus]|uniref:Uncharacterized protein n=1 Tax=Papilio xuthus TaxID=66420 RepID=A0A0N0P9A6_PAPXU|nr:hypothetical protein RR46_01270 [Papilio xuthus]
MYTTWYSRGESGMHHHQMGQLYHHGPPMIKTEAGVNSDCMMAVDYAPPIKFLLNRKLAHGPNRKSIKNKSDPKSAPSARCRTIDNRDRPCMEDKSLGEQATMPPPVDPASPVLRPHTVASLTINLKDKPCSFNRTPPSLICETYGVAMTLFK